MISFERPIYPKTKGGGLQATGLSTGPSSSQLWISELHSDDAAGGLKHNPQACPAGVAAGRTATADEI